MKQHSEERGVDLDGDSGVPGGSGGRVEISSWAPETFPPTGTQSAGESMPPSPSRPADSPGPRPGPAQTSCLARSENED